MADKELASKLAKRLEHTGEQESLPDDGLPPPPVPNIPQKVVKNPYILEDTSFSVDDLILKTLEIQEENNNYQKSLNSPVSPAVPHSPTSPAKSPLPPKQTIRDWLLKDAPQPINAVSKQPIVSIEHHKEEKKVKQQFVPEVDGSELEQKLAAQRAKKLAECLLEPEKSAEVKTETLSATEEKSFVEESHQKKAKPCPVGEEKKAETPEPSSSQATSSEETQRKSSFEELEEQMQREVEEEERRKVEGQKNDDLLKEAPPKPPRLPTSSTVPASPTAMKKGFVPSPLLLEAIRQECGVKSPPMAPPKPNTPLQSPVVTRKPIVSPLGLLCDPLMSIEPPSSPKPQSPKPVKKPANENPEELQAALERQRKINDVAMQDQENIYKLGETVPQFVNRKLSLYAEFSEFTRKQIKSFSETFKKYDEDDDGFIDFNELKRMMEKLGEAQTHIALKEIIRKVDEDQDGKINLREFFLLFRLAAKGEIGCSEVFNQLAESVDVTKEGVLGAAAFFQAKIAEQTKLSKFEEEIKQEQDERKREEEEKRNRREKFLQSKSLFH